jgi:hypothetical protein
MLMTSQTPTETQTPEEKLCAQAVQAAIAFARKVEQDPTHTPATQEFYGGTARMLENICLRGQQACEIAALLLVGDRMKSPWTTVMTGLRLTGSLAAPG